MQKFTGTGVFVTKWGSSGTEEAQFNLPYAVRAGGNGVVYVADSSNHRIQKFQFAIPRFRRADGNQDGVLDISDAVFSLLFLFRAAPLPCCLDALDSNDDGEVDIADPVHSLFSIFVRGAPAPLAPYPGCGRDPTEDSLSCESYVRCN